MNKDKRKTKTFDLNESSADNKKNKSDDDKKKKDKMGNNFRINDNMVDSSE